MSLTFQYLGNLWLWIWPLAITLFWKALPKVLSTYMYMTSFIFFWNVPSAFRFFSDLVNIKLRVDNDTLTRWFLSNAILTLKKYRSVLFYNFDIKPYVSNNLNITCKPAFHVWLNAFQHVYTWKWDTNIFLSWVWGMKLVKNETRSILMAKNMVNEPFKMIMLQNWYLLHIDIMSWIPCSNDIVF